MKTPQSQIVFDACQKHPDLPSRTLARMVYQKHKATMISEAAVYAKVRYYRGNSGAEKRKWLADKSVVRPNQTAPFKWNFPESKAQEWGSLNLESTRTLVLSDIHIPFHDRPAIEALIKWGRKWKPNCILLNGDICDFFSVSRFDRNPTKSSLLEEVASTRAFLGWLREQFPKARIIYKEGNHDEWFDKFIWRKSPELYGLPGLRLRSVLTGANELEPEIGGIEWVGDQGRIKAGHLTILHGHEVGKGSIAPPVNPARGLFLKTNECCLAGHLHRTSHHSERSMNGKLVSCWSTGALCGLWPDYAKVNKWDHSGAAVELDGDDFLVTPVRIMDGRVLQTTG